MVVYENLLRFGASLNPVQVDFPLTTPKQSVKDRIDTYPQVPILRLPRVHAQDEEASWRPRLFSLRCTTLRTSSEWLAIS